MQKLIKAAINDLRLVFRDNSLKVFLALPLITLPVIRYGIPYVVGQYEILNDYIAIILMLATMQGSVAFGFIYSMVLIDEKDTSVNTVYGVLPVSKFWFTVFRLIPPYLFAANATFLLLLVEPFYSLPIASVFIYSAIAGLASPFMIMFVANFASNKIEAMTWQKLFNTPLYLPILSFFVPASISFIFVIFPTYWVYHSLDLIIKGGGIWLYAIAGLIHNVLVITLMVRRFIRGHFK